MSNDKVQLVEPPSNAFIIQDDIGVSLIDVSTNSATLIHSLEGRTNDALFIEKTEGKLRLLTNILDEEHVRNLVTIEINLK